MTTASDESNRGTLTSFNGAGIPTGPPHESLMPMTEGQGDGWATPPPITLDDGTALYLLKDGRALAAAYDAIANARRRICLEVYIFHGDSTGRAFARLLAKRAREGLDVYVIYDSFGSWDTPREIFDEMKSAGVCLREFHPIVPWENQFGWRPFNRDHRKLLVIDDNIAGLGGINIGAEYSGSAIVKSESSDAWRDNGIGIVGPAARTLLYSFIKTWRYIHRGGCIVRMQLIHNIDRGEFGCLASVPTASSPLLPFLRRLFHSARRSIDLTMAYFAPDDLLIEELCRARRRGARVRLMLPSRSDIPILHVAAQSFYELLLSNGIEIHERRDVMLHAKTMVIDESVSIVGSTNFDYRSIEYNCEISSIIRNRQFGAQMTTLFENDMRFADPIRLARWRYRPTLDRLVQWAVSRARYLL